jgi:polysaccharide export outer membrane protein
VSVPWADRVLVVRQTTDPDEPVVITLRIRDAKFDKESNVRLASGDVVSVEESPATLLYDLMNFARLSVGGSVGLF